MQKKLKFSPRARVRSFTYAFTGLWDMLRTEPNAWIHAFATVAVLGLAFWLQVGRVKLCVLILSVVSVWAAEAFNTVLEIMADLVVVDRYSRTVKRAKDVAAAAVLVASMGALAIGLIILGPPLYERLAMFRGRA